MVALWLGFTQPPEITTARLQDQKFVSDDLANEMLGFARPSKLVRSGGCTRLDPEPPRSGIREHVEKLHWGSARSAKLVDSQSKFHSLCRAQCTAGGVSCKYYETEKAGARRHRRLRHRKKQLYEGATCNRLTVGASQRGLRSSGACGSVLFDTQDVNNPVKAYDA